MKQKAFQSLILVFSGLIVTLMPLLAKEPELGESLTSEVLTSESGDNIIQVIDTYTLDSLRKTTHYVELLDNGYSVTNGVLKAAVLTSQKAVLQILPLFGDEFEFLVDAQYTGRPSTEAAFTLLISGGAHFLEPQVVFKIELSKAKISGWFHNGSSQGSSEYGFVPQKWYTFKLTYLNNILSFFINNEESIKLPLTVPGTSNQEPPKELSSGPLSEDPVKPLIGPVSFSFYIEGKENTNEVIFDNLMVSGKKVLPANTVKALKSRFFLGQKEQQLAVFYKPGYEQWANDQLTGSIRYLKEIYDTVYQVHPLFVNLGLVQVKEDYSFQSVRNLYSEALGRLTVSPDDEAEGATAGVAEGTNPDTPLNETDKNPAKVSTVNPDPGKLIDRLELLRFWSAYYAETWMKESIPYLIFQIQDELNHKLVTLKDVHQQHHKLKELDPLAKEQLNTFIDTPLSAASPTSLWKAHIFWYIIYKSLGFEGWQKLHKRIVAGSQALDTTQLKTNLEIIKGTNAANLLTGWLLPGQGTYAPIDSIQDLDRDGLYDLDERLFGTNPQKADSDEDSYPDFSEIQAGYNPLAKKEPEPGVILVDGHFQDWSRTYVFDVDKSNDGGKYDLYLLKYVLDMTNRLFFLKIDFYKPLFRKGDLRSETYYTQIFFDLDNNKETDFRVVIWSAADETQNWLGLYQYTKESGEEVKIVKKKVELKEGEINFKTGDESLEISIPLTFINKNSLFNIMVNGGQDTLLDSFDAGWIKVIPIATYAERPKKVWTPLNNSTSPLKLTPVTR
jgi:hypothetical protein